MKLRFFALLLCFNVTTLCFGQREGVSLRFKQQQFIASGLTITYFYNNITFGFVPLGFDFATSTLGKEWVYHNKRWWGFGI